MIILALILILVGSFGGATVLWLQDAPLWQVALGYVGGGWAGLLGGAPVLLLVRSLGRLREARRRKGGQFADMKR